MMGLVHSGYHQPRFRFGADELSWPFAVARQRKEVSFVMSSYSTSVLLQCSRRKAATTLGTAKRQASTRYVVYLSICFSYIYLCSV